MKIIFGLGNIGEQYQNTYHNMGFMVVDGVKKAFNIAKEKKSCNGLISQTNVMGEKVYLVKPTTYMNNSGECVKSVISKLGADLSDIIVVVDDIDLPAGTVRIKPQGSAGTHNGLKSICNLVGNNFTRLKIGIGKPLQNMDLADYVLSNVPSNSKAKEAVEKGINAVIDYINGTNKDRLMQKYNG